MMTWEILHPGATPEHLGLVPGFLSEDDPRPAREQFDERYAHGGGWRPQGGFTFGPRYLLRYPGDPPMMPIARTRFRNELIMLYPYAYVAIVQPDQSFEICRMD